MKRVFATAALGVMAALFAVGQFEASNVQAQRGDFDNEIASIEEQFRVAKLDNDVVALERILHDSFFEMNQNGNGRYKAETIDLFKHFRIASLNTNSSDVRFSGNVAIVTGSQTEVNGTGTDRMLFTRVYVRNQNRWQLLSSTQFRNPKVFPVSLR